MTRLGEEGGQEIRPDR